MEGEVLGRLAEENRLGITWIGEDRWGEVSEFRSQERVDGELRSIVCLLRSR